VFLIFSVELLMLMPVVLLEVNVPVSALEYGADAPLVPGLVATPVLQLFSLPVDTQLPSVVVAFQVALAAKADVLNTETVATATRRRLRWRWDCGFILLLIGRVCRAGRGFDSSIFEGVGALLKLSNLSV